MMNHSTKKNNDSSAHLPKFIKIEKRDRQTSNCMLKSLIFLNPQDKEILHWVLAHSSSMPCMHEGSCWANFSLRSHTGPKKMNICRQFKGTVAPDWIGLKVV